MKDELKEYNNNIDDFSEIIKKELVKTLGIPTTIEEKKEFEKQFKLLNNVKNSFKFLAEQYITPTMDKRDIKEVIINKLSKGYPNEIKEKIKSNIEEMN